ncbi:hypothetical protein Tco_1025930 [Tanacetum coccineum]
MKDKMIPLDHSKLNALYESFVPQTEISVEQTYFSSPSTSNVSSESSSEKSDLPPKKIPNENTLKECSKAIKQEITEEVQKMLEIFESMERKVEEQSQKDKPFQKEIDQLLEASLEREVRDCVMISVEKQKNEMLILEKEKISNDSKDIQANLLKQIKILENDFKRSQAQSIDFELKLQYQKEKNDYDVSWKSKMAKLNGENMSLNIQVESLEVNEFIENVNQKTYAYGDVHAKNQGLLMTISKLKDKLKTTEKGKNVNTKFDKSMTLDKLICVTLLNKNKELKAKMVSKVEVKMDKSKSVTSCSTPKNEQGQKKNANVIQIVLWIVDIRCSKHMTGNQKLLRNFIKKFIGTVRFRNDHFAGYGDYVQGNLTICHVYYVEGLR